MSRKVVVTGINIITSLGLTMEENWKNLLEGKSGVSKITLFDPQELETQIAAQVPAEFDEYVGQFIKKRAQKQMTRLTQISLVAAKEAINKYNIPTDEFDPGRCAAIMGVVHTANTSIEKNTTAQNKIIKGMNNVIPAMISLEYGFEGPAYSICTACASSAYAIANGYELIKNNQADLVIVGGADSTINPEEIEGFNAIFALSTQNDQPEKASKPFSADRDGFVIGEGAGILILESEESAKKRNGVILAELAGYALTSEAYNIMSPKSDGEGMAATMKKAISSANLETNNIDYINAHGTSTTLNDLYEAKAIKKVFGEHAQQVAVSSSKSMLGHTIGAAGAIEAAITVQSIYDGEIHPTINYDNPDPELDLNFVPNISQKKNIRAALSNSFAFGGHNATLVFKKYDGYST